MEKMWAPWRMQYIQEIDVDKNECVFCAAPARENDRENLILLRGSSNFVIMNKYPYNNGHLMIVPYCHTCDCATLEDNTALELWHLLQLCKQALSRAFSPDGFNIGMNVGRCAGAGIDQHVHMHIVPRWNGDTNFMPIIGDTKVISQGILQTYDSLQPFFSKQANPEKQHS